MIFIESESDQTFPKELLERAARTALDLSGSPDADLTIVLVDDARIQVLNRDFLAHDAPTDVLSFPADEPDPETGRRYLGDVVISLAACCRTGAASAVMPSKPKCSCWRCMACCICSGTIMPKQKRSSACGPPRPGRSNG